MNYILNATPKKLSFSYNSFSLFKAIVSLLNSFNNSFFQYLSSVLVVPVIANLQIMVLGHCYWYYN